MSHSKFIELMTKYGQRNERDGFPQLNCIEFCCRAYPQYATELKAATKALKTEGYSDESIRRFYRAWRKPCLELRKFHAELLRTHGKDSEEENKLPGEGEEG